MGKYSNVAVSKIYYHNCRQKPWIEGWILLWVLPLNHIWRSRQWINQDWEGGNKEAGNIHNWVRQVGLHMSGVSKLYLLELWTLHYSHLPIFLPAAIIHTFILAHLKVYLRHILTRSVTGQVLWYLLSTGKSMQAYKMEWDYRKCINTMSLQTILRTTCTKAKDWLK